MKIGIITFHRAHNYGAVLQCFALQKALMTISDEVYVIDYRQKAIEKAYYLYNMNDTLNLFFEPKLLLKYLWQLPHKIKREKVFRDFSKKYLHLTSSCTQEDIPSDFDRYVIGSDQLWVPNLTGGKFDEVYQGNFMVKESAIRFTYALSLNAKSIQQIGKDKLYNASNNFFTFSVREKEIYDTLKSFIKVPIRVDVDPTLLLDFSEWNSLVDDKWSNRKKYILTYHLPGRYKGLSKKIFDDKVYMVAKRLGCDVISLYPMKFSVIDFISLFKYAEAVITTSFHATVFSLIFKKNFLSVMLDDGNDLRYFDLLQKVKATDALTDVNFENKEFPNLDYSIIDAKLSDYRKPSLDYLRIIASI